MIVGLRLQIEMNIIYQATVKSDLFVMNTFSESFSTFLDLKKYIEKCSQIMWDFYNFFFFFCPNISIVWISL